MSDKTDKTMTDEQIGNMMLNGTIEGIRQALLSRMEGHPVTLEKQYSIKSDGPTTASLHFSGTIAPNSPLADEETWNELVKEITFAVNFGWTMAMRKLIKRPDFVATLTGLKVSTRGMTISWRISLDEQQNEN